MDAGKVRPDLVMVDKSSLDKRAEDAACDQISYVKQDLYQTRGVIDANTNMLDLPNLAKDDQVFISELWPTTPDSIRDRHHFAASSPLSMTKPDAQKQSEGATYADIFTPKGSVFDPLIAHWHPKQCGHEDKPSSAVRNLNFDNAAAAASQMIVEEKIVSEREEETLFRNIYGTILEDIVLKQTTMGAAVSDIGFHSPPSAPKLSGVADTCPPAPVKQPNRSKFRNIDRSICRKLEF